MSTRAFIEEISTLSAENAALRAALIAQTNALGVYRANVAECDRERVAKEIVNRGLERHDSMAKDALAVKA
jgi:hypothetical protein